MIILRQIAKCAKILKGKLVILSYFENSSTECMTMIHNLKRQRTNFYIRKFDGVSITITSYTQKETNFPSFPVYKLKSKLYLKIKSKNP